MNCVEFCVLMTPPALIFLAIQKLSFKYFDPISVDSLVLPVIFVFWGFPNPCATGNLR